MRWSHIPPISSAAVTVLAFGLDRVEVDESALSETERLRADEFHSPIVAARFRAARAVLRAALGSAIGLPAERVGLATDRLGKPWLPGHPDRHFNLSHSGEQGLVAIGPCPLGVDIEEITLRHSDNEPLARFVLDAAAFDAWSRLDSAGRADMLCRAWTLKEACVKARGTGIGEQALGTLLLPSSGYGPIAPGAGGAPPWWVRPLPAPWGYHAALCTEGMPPALRIHRLDASGWTALPDPETP